MQICSASAAVMTVLVAVIGFTVTNSLNAAVATSETRGITAYIDGIVPTGARLDDVVDRIEDARGKPVPIVGSSVDLSPGDKIFIKQIGSGVYVRMLTRKEFTYVYSHGTKEADFVVPSSRIPGVSGALAALLRPPRREATGNEFRIAGARGDSTCYNVSGKTDEPTQFDIPALSAESPSIGAGRRDLLVSWRGGASPFSVTVQATDTGRIVAEQARVIGTCATRLPSALLTPGRYRLRLTDSNGVSLTEENLRVENTAPVPPRELLASGLPPDAQEFYFATWLAEKDNGRWAFEAVQRISRMDCKSASVQEWLGKWGGLLPECVDAQSR